MTIKDVSPLSPLSFFAISADVPYLEKAPKKWLKNPYLLPDTSAYLSEESFAKVAMGWNEDGLLIHVAVKKSFEEAFFPEAKVKSPNSSDFSRTIVINAALSYTFSPCNSVG